MESKYAQFGTSPDGTELMAKICWQAKAENGAKAAKPIAILFHLGGLVQGSADFVWAPHVQYLTSHNFIAVIPNYRLSPQVSASEGAFQDAETILSWVRSNLSSALPDSISADPSRVVTVGYSSGGTLALSLAAKHPEALKAVTAFYPSLYLSELSSTAHQPASFMAGAPDFDMTPENRAAVFPDKQLTAFALAPPGTPAQPRHAWMNSHLKHGTWIKAVQPDGDFAALDPLTMVGQVGARWPPTMFVQGRQDFVPASSVANVERALKDLQAAGVKEVRVEIVEDSSHAFDAPPVGVTDLGAKWESVKKGLAFVIDHV